MKKFIKGLLVLALLCLPASLVNGSILYSAAPDGTAGTGWNSNSGNQQQVAQDFVLGTAGTVNTISFFGYFQSDFDDAPTFELEFFNDLAGAPVSPAFYGYTSGVVNGVETGIDDTGGHSILRYDVAVTNQALTAGTAYWFGVKSNSIDTWVWSHSSIGSGNVFARYSDNDAWQEIGTGTRDNQAFEIAGDSAPTVPEPGTLIIWSVFAGTGLVFSSRRRRA